MSDPRYPALYQINTRVWLTELSRTLGKRATLDDIPDAELDRLAELGFDWVWLLSVWQTGPAAQAISRANPGWRREFAATLPDLKDEDIAGSGFAIQSYTVHRDLGGAAALARLRKRLQERGLKLMLDFVPNHMAPDHAWVDEHPDYFVHGSESDLARAPQNYCRVQTKNGTRVLAYGRDPYFDGWPDTLQLDYGNPDLQQAMIGELTRIAGQCDGVRCDMAMLVLPDVFERTWGIRADLFWPKATESVRAQAPALQVHGRGLLGPGMDDAAAGVRLHLRQAALRPPARGSRPTGARAFPRRARLPGQAGPLPRKPRRAAGGGNVLTGGPRGRGGHHVPVAGAAVLPPGSVPGAQEAYLSSLGARASGTGRQPAGEVLRPAAGRAASVRRCATDSWQLLDCTPAWEGNWTWDCFLAFAWQGPGDERLLVTVNYAPNQSQCYVQAAIYGPGRQPMAARGCDR